MLLKPSDYLEKIFICSIDSNCGLAKTFIVLLILIQRRLIQIKIILYIKQNVIQRYIILGIICSISIFFNLEIK